MRLAAVLAVLVFAASACSSKDKDDKVSATATTRDRTTTSFDEESTSTSDGGTTTSAAAGATTTTRRNATTNPTSAPGVTPAPVDKPALKQVGTLDKPIAFATRPNDGAVYIAQKGGKVLRLGINSAGNLQALSTPLDITSKVSTSSEQGLLGITFSPNGSKLYAYYTATNGNNVLSEFPFANNAAGAERQLFNITDPYENHNGGNIAFGPDGMLYIGTGDGGSAGDPENRAQDLNSTFGKMLRINPTPSNGQPYTIPGDNPFAGQTGKRGEIWHYGLRNPWRWSFDRANGDLWIGDVGQNAWEEIDHVGAGAKGVNFGWRPREGKHAYNGGAKPAGAVDPVYELSHDDGNAAVTGGYVYRGTGIRGFAGTYVFIDVYKGRLLGMTNGSVRDLGVPAAQIVSFGEDASGELWLLSLKGAVYRLVAS